MSNQPRARNNIILDSKKTKHTKYGWDQKIFSSNKKYEVVIKVKI